MSKEKVLITGGAGYLGSVLTGLLLEKGYLVNCYGNLQYGQRSLLNYVSNKKFNFIFGDVRNKSLLKENVSKNDVIIPLAAIVGMPACQARPFEARATNLESIIELDSMRSRDQRIIYPTTNSGYGTKSGDIFCNENTPLEPISLYGRTKVEAEQFLLNSKKDSITLRLATVFGFSPRMRMDLLVNDFVYQAMTVGCIKLFEKDFKRNYVHIRDVGRVFLHSIENFGNMKNEPYNVGLDEANLSKEELAKKIKQHIPSFEIYEGKGEDIDKRNYIISNEKIKLKGFKTKFSLDQGISELIKGYEIILKTNRFKNL